MSIRFEIKQTTKMRPYSDFFPINDPKGLSENEFSDLDETEKLRWSAFKIISKSRIISDILLEKQDGICPVCEKSLIEKKTVIHHIDYFNLCHYGEFFKEKRPTPKRPNRLIRIPKCDICADRQGCLDRVILIHQRCHISLHTREGRRIPKKREDSTGDLFDKSD